MSEARSVTALPAALWRNGGGVTREVLRGPVDRHGEPSWRISIATVSDAAEFSAFPGYQRLFVPLEHERIVLLGPDGVLAADRFGAVLFDGAAAVRARVEGPPVDAVNVMTRPRSRAWIRPATMTGGFFTTSPSRKAVVVLSGVVTEPGHADIPAPAVVVAGTRAAVVEARVLEIFIEPTTAASQEQP